MHHLSLAFIFAPQDVMLIVGVALLIFGPKRLPEIGQGLGKSMRDFKEALNGDGKPMTALPVDVKVID
jgi:sec-independent protein translocase protein TatA